MEQAQRPANWQPVLVSLIQQHRSLDAMKLLALALYTKPGKRPDYERAIKHLSAIQSLEKPIPDGLEHSDIDETVLAPYRDKSRQQ